MLAAACAKHFAAHSGPESQRHSFDTEVSEKDLRETYLPAFEMLEKGAPVESVMGAYNRLNGVPCCGNGKLLEEILRKDWGLEGHVVSDCGAIRNFHTGHRQSAQSVLRFSRARQPSATAFHGCRRLLAPYQVPQTELK